MTSSHSPHPAADPSRPIIANWYAQEVNFGDLITPFLIRAWTGEVPLNLLHTHRGLNPRMHAFGRPETWMALRQYMRRKRQPEYMMVGSILGWKAWAPDVQIVWGSGFMSDTNVLRNRPRAIIAVRGDLTRNQLPAAWRGEIATIGDPGLLVADMVPDLPDPVPGRIGFVPHFTHKRAPLLQTLTTAPDIHVIDIQQDVVPFMRELATCEVVVATAMHGLIAADGLGRPTRWASLPGHDMPAGGLFKFHDYFSAAGLQQDRPDPIATADDIRAAAGRAIQRDVGAVKRALRDTAPFDGARR
jgi:pyruvyltransferase